jgi:hypothetical protein
LNLRRIALDDRLRIADEHVGRVVVGGIDKRLNLNGTAFAQPLTKNPTE